MTMVSVFMGLTWRRGTSSEGTPLSWSTGNPGCLPTKLCFSVSHSGAARTPLATSAKKAFFTCWPRIKRINWTQKNMTNVKSITFVEHYLEPFTHCSHSLMGMINDQRLKNETHPPRNRYPQYLWQCVWLVQNDGGSRLILKSFSIISHQMWWRVGCSEILLHSSQLCN